MNTVVREGDIVTVTEYGKFAVVKTVECDNVAYHYIIKLKEDTENPEVLFVSELIDEEENLELIPVSDNALFNKLLAIIRAELKD